MLAFGNAIKISNRNNINVDTKTNTTEQTTIGDTDLFLLSDTTGKTIKYITGSNLISEVSGDILAGTNLNKTGSTINLDDVVTGMRKVAGTYNLYLSTETADRLILESTGIRFLMNGEVFEINETAIECYQKLTLNSNAINLTSSTDSNHQIMYSNTGMDGVLVRGFGNNIPFFRLQCSNGNINVIDVSRDKIEMFKPVEFEANSATLGAKLILKMGSGNQSNNADYELKQEYLTSGFRSGKYDAGVRFQRFLASSDFTQLFCGYQEDEGQSVILNPNNDLHYIFRSGGGPFSGILKISKPDQSAHNFNIDLGNAASTFTMSSLTNAIFDCDTFTCASSRLVAKKSNDILYLFNNASLPTVIGDNNEWLQQYGDGSFLHLRAAKMNFLSGTNEVLVLDNSLVSCKKKLAMNSLAINLAGSADDNHQVVYSNTGMDGCLIRGFGDSQPFFRLQETVTTRSDTNIMDVYKDKITMLKQVNMENNKINLQSGNNNHYIQFSNTDDADGVEVVGYGAGAKAIFRVACSNASPQTKVIEAKQDEILFYKSLIFPSVGGGTDKAAIKYTSDKKLRISFPESGELRFDKEGSTVNYFKTIKQGSGANGRTFFFEQGGDTDTSNGGAFQSQNSQGKLLFQSDRNLVIYRRSDNSVSFASGGEASSRDYKKNITDLVEDESVNIIKQINPISFEYIKSYWDAADSCDACGCDKRKGFIWEDVKPILPQAAKSINCDNADMPMTKLLDLKQIIPDLTKTVQYLLNKIEKLESQINNI